LPYAAFQLGDFTGEPIGFTARIRGAVLQFTAPALVRTAAVEDELRAIDGFNYRWGLGRIYHQVEQDFWEAAETLYVGDTTPDSPALTQAVSELVDVAHLVRDRACFERDESAMAAFFERGRQRIPIAANGSTMLDVEGALSRLGLRYRLSDDGQRLLLRLRESNEREFLVDIFKTEQKYLHVRAQHVPERAVPEDQTTFQKLQRLNAGVLTGAVLFAPDPPRLYHRAVLPLAWAKIDAETIGWLIDHAAAALEAIEDKVTTTERAS
jgi:hypothetical protein